MDVYVSWDGDHAGRLAGRSRMSDDVEQVRRVSQAIDAGNEVWKSFALRVGGSLIEMGGDEGAIEIDACYLSELPEIAEQYSKAVGCMVSVGVGLKLSESSKSLMVAKLRGGNQILIYDPSMEATLSEAQEKPKSEEEKISDEYLEKANSGEKSQHNTGKVRGAHAGFATQHRAGAKATGEDPEAKAVKDTIKAANREAGPAPAASEGGVSGSMHNDFEAMLHQAAQGQEQDDGNQEVGEDVEGENIKQKIVKILGQVKQQLPYIATLQQTAPDAYMSVMNLVQGVILLGRQMNGPDQEQNRPIDGEEPANLSKAISQIPAGQAIKAPKGVEAAHDYTHVLPEQHKAAGMKLTVEHSGPMVNAYLHAPGKGVPVGHVDGFINHKKNGLPRSIEPHSELNPEFRGKGLGTAMYEALYSHAKHKLGINRVEGGSHSADADAVHKRLAEKHGVAYRPKLRQATARAFDKFPYAKYSYTIKEEMSANLSLHEDEFMGPGNGLDLMCDCEHHDLTKDELEKGGLGSSGGSEAGRVHENLPIGTIKDNKMKVHHSDGGVTWEHVSSGMVGGQDGGSQPFGEDSHPVSSKTPNGK